MPFSTTIGGASTTLAETVPNPNYFFANSYVTTPTSWYGSSVATDAQNNYYWLSYLNNQLSLVKQNSFGVQQWAVQINSPLYNLSYGPANAIVIDNAGNIIVSIVTTGTTSSYDILVAKYNSSGTLQWIKQITGTAALGLWSPIKIGIDSANNIYIPVGTTGAVSQIIKLNSSGVFQWQKGTYANGGTSSWPIYNSVVVDSSNNVTVIGLNNTTPLYASVSQFNSSGTLNWSLNLNTSVTNSNVGGLAIDSSNNIYTVYNNGTNDYLCKISSTGTLLWSMQCSLGNSSGISFPHYFYSIATDAIGNVYFTTTNSIGTLVYLLKVNSSGTLLKQCQITTTGNSVFALTAPTVKIAISSLGNIILSGSIQSNKTTTYYVPFFIVLPSDFSFVGTNTTDVTSALSISFVSTSLTLTSNLLSTTSTAQTTSALSWTVPSSTYTSSALTTTTNLNLLNLPTYSKIFTTAGTYTWTCPSGVTSVSVICIGGGGSGYSSNNPNSVGSKGGGTALYGAGTSGAIGATGSANIYSGNGYGGGAGGIGSMFSFPPGSNGNAGGQSYFASTSVCAAGGGGGGSTSSASGGTVIAGTGFSGGASSSSKASGGGSAGGYTANGATSNTAGSGGAGGGGSNGSSFQNGGTGGGGGALAYINSYSVTPGNTYTVVVGVGGAATNFGPNVTAGTSGAVRICWGSGAAFPSTNVNIINNESAGF
jgi:hypothetical protein